MEETTQNYRLPNKLILDELFDLLLYKKMRKFAKGDLAEILDELIAVETHHFKFWQDFFGKKIEKLDFARKIKLAVLIVFARIFGEKGIHVILQSIEIYGIKKYLNVWERYKEKPLGTAVRKVLDDEFGHEDKIVSRGEERQIKPESIRDLFLGFNDGLVEILGAVSGFFAAFSSISAVLTAGMTVAVAGAISMGAGAYAALSSQREVETTEYEKEVYLGNKTGAMTRSFPVRSGFVVGIAYLAGSLVPLLPVLLGAKNIYASVITAGITIIVISYILAFLSGMDTKRRIGINILVVSIAVSVTYIIGTLAKYLLGIEI